MYYKRNVSLRNVELSGGDGYGCVRRHPLTTIYHSISRPDRSGDRGNNPINGIVNETKKEGNDRRHPLVLDMNSCWLLKAEVEINILIFYYLLFFNLIF